MGNAAAAVTQSIGGHSSRSYEVAVAEPFRLDLTVNALRRLPTNVVDRFTDSGKMPQPWILNTPI